MFASAQTRSYSVGNSLSQNGFQFSNIPSGSAFEQITRREGITHETAGHIRCGSSLNATLANPTNVCVPTRSPYGLFSEALPNYDWDYVTIQPYPGSGSTLGTDQSSIETLIDLTRQNPANNDTTFYIYAAWPAQDTGVFDQVWEGVSADDPNAPTQIRRSYYQNLHERVRSETDATVNVIPVGEVFFKLNQKIQANQVPGVSSLSSFYRDNDHLNYTGSFLAAMSIYSTLFKTTPVGVPRIASLYGTESETTPGLTDIIQQTVWDVISNDPNTGYADLNNDETVDALDLDLWQSGFGGTEPLAKTGDDFLVWQRTLSPPPASLATVPEPSAGLLCLLGFASLFTRRRVRVEAGR